MASRIPPLLEPYLSLPPEASLILLTSVLGASSNWLVLRFLHRALVDQDGAPEELSPRGGRKVVLMSFMRDLSFWKENARRLGLDLDKLAAKKRFAFVDGLSGLFLPKQQRPLPAKVGEKILSKPDLTGIAEEVQQLVRSLKDGQGEGQVLLIIDQIDLLLAAGGDHITAVALGEMLMGLREEVDGIVVTLSADYPLVAGHQTPLETDHAVFLLSLAHQADFIMSLRLLDSGTARDVSGVIRITVGDQAPDVETHVPGNVEQTELLYFVGGDGGVKVFERGQ